MKKNKTLELITTNHLETGNAKKDSESEESVSCSVVSKSLQPHRL